ncbi:MAG: ATP-dependent helicase HrpB [Pseudomonadota bacterium]
MTNPSKPRLRSEPELPIDAVLADVKDALGQGSNLVVIAPPGAGKTTGLPLHLLDAGWLENQRIVLVEPRRLAAIGAARRMASLLGEKVGETVGHRVRLDTKVSGKTRLEVVTDGVFTRMIQSDPELAGIGLILFDEVHERALAADLGLAFALETQAVLRPDLRLVAMSATVEGEAFHALMGRQVSCRTIISDGRAFAVETHYEPSAEQPVEATVDAALSALARFEGDGLAFLPGQREIENAARLARDRLIEQGLDDGVVVHPLYGAVSREAQDSALAPDPDGRRKLVIASAIAETSLTIPGVRFVVDSGLARRPIYDPLRGITRLETRSASRASIDQRRGRAGRTAPGHCVRLWRREEEGGRPAQDRPEILDADLAATRLAMAAWGSRARDGLPFLDPPPQNAWDEAGRLLTDLGALTAEGDLTTLGKDMVASTANNPRLAAMMAHPDGRDSASGLAWAAVLAGELGDRGAIEADRRLAEALADRRHAKALRALHRRLMPPGSAKAAEPPSAHTIARLLLRAFPDRVAMRQRDDGQTAIYKLAQGMQARLPAHHPLAKERFLIVLDLGGGRSGRGAHVPDIRLALAVDHSALEDVLGDRIQTQTTRTFDVSLWTVQVRDVTRLGSLVLSEHGLPRPNEDVVQTAIADHVRASGLSSLTAGDAKTEAVLARHEAFHDAQGQADALTGRVDLWLPTLIGSGERPPFAPALLDRALRQALDWQEGQAFDQLYPTTVALPEGRQATIQYDHPAGPTISVRGQWLYGLDQHPGLRGGSKTVRIELLSPAQRPIATTSDLPGFWRGGWADVRKDMRARYPKHDWPQEPWKAQPLKRR